MTRLLASDMGHAAYIDFELIHDSKAAAGRRRRLRMKSPAATRT